MKTKSSKSDNSAAIAEFLAKGGQITKCPTMKPNSKRNNQAKGEPTLVEIVIDDLPPELRAKHFPKD